MFFTIYQKNYIIGSSIFFIIFYYIYKRLTFQTPIKLWDILYTSFAFCIIIFLSVFIPNTVLFAI